MSDHQSSEQEANIKKMNELLEEKNKETSDQQDFTQQEQKNQSVKDSARIPDENNKFTNKNNNRTP
ncbi:hypothetical protein FQV26_13280 [Planococcus sp. CPCC 101016]|uniref:hypothetical protein n=1 Tax=Planococcus sp. CPCC 101016 TaxID=2599617 RepID=UPI0011B4B807|nr:hypothetical protein [Planococcus sp. CPCC 101016]TWT05404.1 hypothetical protein FQV26_13280 [Planococcus sp. CPCC 101016]